MLLNAVENNHSLVLSNSVNQVEKNVALEQEGATTKYWHFPVQHHHPYQQEDGFPCGPLVVPMNTNIAYQLNPKKSILNTIEIYKHFWNFFQKLKKDPID